MSGLPEMPCAELVERVTEFLEGEMPARDRQRLEEHLTECPACAMYIEQLRETLRLTGSLQEDDVPEAMRGELLDAFARWKQSR